MRKNHINPFENKRKEELILLYSQFLEAEKTCIISSDSELGKIRDIYLGDFGSGHAIYMLQFELTHTLSDLWYEDNRHIIKNTKRRKEE